VFERITAPFWSKSRFASVELDSSVDNVESSLTTYHRPSAVLVVTSCHRGPDFLSLAPSVTTEADIQVAAGRYRDDKWQSRLLLCGGKVMQAFIIQSKTSLQSVYGVDHIIKNACSLTVCDVDTLLPMIPCIPVQGSCIRYFTQLYRIIVTVRTDKIIADNITHIISVSHHAYYLRQYHAYYL
jgi:hypothetical protein